MKSEAGWFIAQYREKLLIKFEVVSREANLNDLDDKSYKNDVDCGCWATNVSEKLQRVDLVEKRSVSTVL